MTYRVTKTYGHELGLSACFRQWRAFHSHCRFLHGYALSFTFDFESESLDLRNWVIDFGGLKPIKEWLTSTFDHSFAVAQDDPDLELFRSLAKGANGKTADIILLPAVGCEAFAELAFNFAEVIADGATRDKAKAFENIGREFTPKDIIRVTRCEVREHGGNSASYMGSSNGQPMRKFFGKDL